MSLDERYRLFGDPTDSLVPEAVWAFHEEHGDWPLWDEVLDTLVTFMDVPSREDAERRLECAIRDGEVIPRLRARGETFGLELSEDVAARVVRRYMDLTMPRRDKEEQW